MAISLDLRTCRLGAGTRKVKNPFDVCDGQEIEVPDDGGLTSPEKNAVKTVLAKIAGPTPPSEYVDWSKEFDDRGMVEVWASGLDDESVVNAISVIVWRRSPFVAMLLFELSQHGNLALVTQVEGIGPWVTSAEQLESVKGRWPTAKVVSTAAELAKQIAKYRDELDTDVH